MGGGYGGEGGGVLGHKEGAVAPEREERQKPFGYFFLDCNSYILLVFVVP